MKKMIIASTSTLHGGNYLEYLMPVLENHFQDCEEILFIPYERPGGISHDDYTAVVRLAFAKIKKVPSVLLTVLFSFTKLIIVTPAALPDSTVIFP